MNARNETAGIQEYSDEQVGITAKFVCEGHVNRDETPERMTPGLEKQQKSETFTCGARQVQAPVQRFPAASLNSQEMGRPAAASEKGSGTNSAKHPSGHLAIGS